MNWLVRLEDTGKVSLEGRPQFFPRTLFLMVANLGLIHLCGQFSVDCKRIVCRVLLLGHSWRYALVTNHDIRPFSSDRNSDRKGEQGR